MQGNELYPLRELERTVRKLEKDMYHGNGKPGMTERLGRVEDIIERTNRNLSKIVWLLVAMVVMIIGDLITRAVK